MGCLICGESARAKIQTFAAKSEVAPERTEEKPKKGKGEIFALSDAEFGKY